MCVPYVVWTGRCESTRHGLKKVLNGKVCECQTLFGRESGRVLDLVWKGKCVSTRHGLEGKVCESQSTRHGLEGNVSEYQIWIVGEGV